MPFSICNIALSCFGGGGDGHDPGCCWKGVQSGIERGAETTLSRVWNLTLGGVVNLLFLYCNAKTLDEEVKKLTAVNDDVRDAVDAAGKCPHTVSTWMQCVDKLTNEVEGFQETFHSRSVFIRFPCLSYDAANLLGKIGRLMTEGKEFQVSVGPTGRPSPGSRYVPANLMEARYEEVRRKLEVQERVVAVFGRVGVGKTTLLNIIYNSESQSKARSYNVVILVSLEEGWDVGKIQKRIGKRLGLTLPEDQFERADCLRQCLSTKKFLLLLDNLLDRGLLDLGQIGIPDLKKNGSKIVFTTASPDITNLGERVVDLKPLENFEQSWDLFAQRLSDDVKDLLLEDQPIKATAERIVRLCDGIPSVLLTVAQAIPRRRPSPDEWENIFSEFEDSIEDESIGEESSIRECQGMKRYLSSLELTYKFLPSETLQECFLYCSLFPNGSDIDRRQLLEYWIGEGLLYEKNMPNSLNVLRRRASKKMNALVDAYLLLDGRVDKVNTVRLAKFASLMAKDLTDGSNGRKKFVACAGKGIMEVGEVQGWDTAEKVSLMKNNIERLANSSIPNCQSLRTFLINDNPQLVIVADSSREDPVDAMQVRLQSASEAESSALASSSPSTISSSVHNDHSSLFMCMTGLRVLDLSSTSIDELPASIKLLVDLQYLNLSHTNIKTLPAEVGELKGLQLLNLRGTELLRTIPHRAISRLSKLQMLNLYDGQYYPRFDEVPESERWECWSTLEKLEEVGVNIRAQFPLNLPSAYVTSIRRRTRFLRIGNAEERSGEINPIERLTLDGSHFPNLEVLQLLDLPASTVQIDGTLKKLRHLHIKGCSELSNLDWVQHLPRLEEIHVRNCGNMNNGSCSQKLNNVNRERLPKLRIICSPCTCIH